MTASFLTTLYHGLLVTACVGLAVAGWTVILCVIADRGDRCGASDNDLVTRVRQYGRGEH